MRQYLWGAVVCLGFGTGCTQMLVPGNDLEAKMRGSSAAPPVPVSAEQVTPQNAHQQSQALWEELDRDTNRDLLGAAPGGAAKRK